MESRFIDLHIHPAMKPLGKSFNSKPGKNHSNKNRSDSIWHADQPTFPDKLANILLTLTKFRQADFATLARGGAHVVCASLCGLEKGFLMTKVGTGLPGDLLNNLIVGIGKKRIDHIQKMDTYFPDLELEYNFYKQLNDTQFRIDGRKYKYKIISGFNEIEDEPEDGIKTIYIILTIEGSNVFNAGLKMMGKQVNPDEVLANVDKVKNWNDRLFFVGMTHHFNNEMVGHAPSLHGIVSKLCDQTEGMNAGFNDLGKKVLHKLLDDSNGRRVLIDLKHLSVKARQEYYQILQEDYEGQDIPLLVSHGAVNGLRSFDKRVEDDLFNKGKFQLDEINFFDEELIKIAETDGLFGIQFDERRLGSKMEIKKSGGSLNRRKMLFKKSKLVWNQLQHIAEVLNRNGQYAWGIQCIGSDYDGIVNSLNGFWTAEEMPLFESYLEKHAYNFTKSEQWEKMESFNRLEASDIVERFMYENAYTFLKKHF